MTDPATLDGWLGTVDVGQPVVEHGEFREGVSCAAVVVPRSSPDAPVWAIVVSTRTDEVPPEVGAELMRAARDLAAAPA